MSDKWYEVVPPAELLTQGDIINECPIPSWRDIDTLTKENLVDNVQGRFGDVVVMTQACDLKHDHVDEVVLCVHYSIKDYYAMWAAGMIAARQNPTERGWKSHCDDIKDGHIWNLAVLEQCEEQVEPSGIIKHAHRIVDFSRVYSLPKRALEGWVRNSQNWRPRLRPPYREHLSQGFARFFMRVGLPSDVTRVWDQQRPQEGV